MVHIFFDNVLIAKAASGRLAVEIEKAWEDMFRCYATRCKWDGDNYLNYSNGKYNEEWIRSKSLIRTKGVIR